VPPGLQFPVPADDDETNAKACVRGPGLTGPGPLVRWANNSACCWLRDASPTVQRSMTAFSG